MASIKPTQYLFIDGACLRTTITEVEKTYTDDRVITVDFGKLTQHFDKVFYYDALPSKHGGETDDQFTARLEQAKSFHDKLGELDRFHVYEGDTRRSPSLRKQQQKKVDIMIAVDMLTHSFRRNMERATLLASDVDFKPLLDALVAEGMFVTLWYPPKRTNTDLIKSADRREQLDVRAIHGALAGSSVQFDIPQLWYSGGKSEGEVIRTWEADEGEVGLYTTERGFMVIAPKDARGMYLHIQHSEMTLLKIFSQDVFAISLP
ncbi:hypothetical protein ABIA99_002129 [Bradyrhizobium sp. LB12.1]|uniref:NYN domain-containing protein n=1 Tax=Bradyrhizobium sp. LB12.1 TaxID=3156327 RepID=UPI003399C389